MSDNWPAELLADGRSLRDVGGGVRSALPSSDAGAPYDRTAAAYDRLVRSRLYNRAVWSTSPEAYVAFAADAIGSSDGPLLDVGCGTALFTAALYRASRRRIALVDRSQGMLARAAQRIGGRFGAAGPALLQADLFGLPFRPGSFDTVTCHGVLHLMDDVPAVLRALREQAAPGAGLFASSLVGESSRGRAWLRMLHKAGEVVAPRSAAEVVALARAEWGERVEVRRDGCMLFLTARA
ncbi:class I SAM-dependent DNA methyltransferase [Pseudonocardia sp. TRM90224]|uniref:class I SAM-dependent DNA methyltransferase n=1 Tax=Pseudonocardia sp. TRM90224 TaxID=2812678 RepID=UPI001E30FB26|nr:class I SAM-dependent methyltransferase [Pseudonocardia sp. TRM90224]